MSSLTSVGTGLLILSISLSASQLITRKSLYFSVAWFGSMALANINSILNPILYAGMNKRLRKFTVLENIDFIDRFRQKAYESVFKSRRNRTGRVFHTDFSFLLWKTFLQNQTKNENSYKNPADWKFNDNARHS